MWRLLVCFISAIFCKRDVVQLECMQVGAAMTATVEAGVIERCNGAVLELVPCSDSIKGPGADPVSHGCCMALSELLLSPECLCYAATISQGFDMKQILGLPAACKFHVKPHQACEGSMCSLSFPIIAAFCFNRSGIDADDRWWWQLTPCEVHLRFVEMSSQISSRKHVCIGIGLAMWLKANYAL